MVRSWERERREEKQQREGREERGRIESGGEDKERRQAETSVHFRQK